MEAGAEAAAIVRSSSKWSLDACQTEACRFYLVVVRKSQSSFSPKPYNAALELGGVPVDSWPSSFVSRMVRAPAWQKADFLVCL